MADQILVTASTLESVQSTLTTAAGNAEQCVQDAQNTISQLQGAWKGKGCDSYVELLTNLSPKMKEAVQVYNEIATNLKAYVARMEGADKF